MVPFRLPPTLKESLLNHELPVDSRPNFKDAVSGPPLFHGRSLVFLTDIQQVQVCTQQQQ